MRQQIRWNWLARVAELATPATLVIARAIPHRVSCLTAAIEVIEDGAFAHIGASLRHGAHLC